MFSCVMLSALWVCKIVDYERAVISVFSTNARDANAVDHDVFRDAAVNRSVCSRSSDTVCRYSNNSNSNVNKI